jgi:large subunit ribosomal protein L25
MAGATDPAGRSRDASVARIFRGENEMETTSLQAEVRAVRGKGPARRLRAQGQIPAIVYGPALEPTALTLSPKELTKALEGPKGRNVVFTLSFDGKDLLAMVKDLTVDPVTRVILHADFLRVTEDRPIDIVVPVTTHGRPIGVQKGGKLTVVFRELPIRTVPKSIPVSIDIDVAKLDIGGAVTVADLQLPEGVSVTLPKTKNVVGVFEERKTAEEEAAATPAGS